MDPWTTLPSVVYRDRGEFVDTDTNKSYLRFRKDEPKIPLAENKNILTLSGSVQENVERMTRHLGVHWSSRYQALGVTWAHPSKRYNCRDGHAVHSVPRMQTSSSLLRNRRPSFENSRGSDSHEPGETFSPGRDRNEVLSSFRGRCYP